jgi:predicted nucleic acid-binding protein
VYVIDAWAALALLEGQEPAAERVDEALTTAHCLMSWINLGEVAYIVSRRHGPTAAADVVRDLRQSVSAVVPTEDSVLAAAAIRATHRLSYADAFAATTAITSNAILLTGDPELLVTGSAWRWEDLR